MWGHLLQAKLSHACFSRREQLFRLPQSSSGPKFFLLIYYSFSRVSFSSLILPFLVFLIVKLLTTEADGLFAFWQRKHVFFSLGFYPKICLAVSLTETRLCFFPKPYAYCCMVKRRAMENFVVILMGTSPVTSYKTAIIYLHIRAALVFKNSFSTRFCPGVPLGKRSGLRASAAPSPLCVLTIKP